jgi:NhaA family Na+:H+ antiporter
VAAVALLGGIGFTVSLFFSQLAFTDPGQVAAAKLGVLAASVIAGLGGYPGYPWLNAALPRSVANSQ